MSEVAPQPVEAVNTGDQAQQSQSEPQTGKHLNPVERLVQRYAAKQAAPEVKATEEATSEATEPEGKEPPEGKPEEGQEDEDKHELRLRRVRNDLKKAQTEAVQAKKRADELESKVNELGAKIKKNPLKAVEEITGMTLREIMVRGAKGEFEDEYQKLPEELREKLSWVDKLKAEQDAKAQQEAQRAQREQALAQLTQAMPGYEADAPIFTALPFSAEAVLERAYEEYEESGVQPDIREIVEELEQTTSKNFTEFLTNDKLVQRLVKIPLIRTSLMKALGLPTERTPAGPASDVKGKNRSEDGPRTLPNSITQEVPVRTAKPKSRDEEIEESVRLWRQAKAKANAQ